MSTTTEERERKLRNYRAFRERNIERWREINREAGRRYRANNKEKLKARSKVFVEVRAGRLVKELCHCGSAKTQAHHEDYTKPLAVMWFCAKHHREFEREVMHSTGCITI
jgi:hypothetical protein